MAFGLGAAEMLLMIALGGGIQAGDLVSYLPADTYFKSRDIPVNLDNMIYLAAKDPADGAAQLKQLLCLRVLAEQPELFKKGKGKDKAEALTVLRKIARGELANDKQGFAKDYALRALAVLDGGKEAARPAAPALDDGLAWFPANATLAGVIDPRRRDGVLTDSLKDFRALFTKMLRPDDRDEVFKVLETLGNIRIERLSFAFADLGKGRGQDRFYVRVTGKADHKRLVEAIKTLSAGEPIEFNETKDAKGTPITTIHEPNDSDAPIAALIGDTDLVVAATTGRRKPDPDPRPLLDALLAVRDGKAPSVLKGALKDRLTVGKASYGVIAGALPDELREELARGGPPAPRSLRVEMMQAKDGVDLKLHATMANAEEAGTFAKFIVMSQQQALRELQKLPEEFKILPASVMTGLKKALESVQVQAKGAAIEGNVHLPSSAMLAAPYWLMYFGVDAAPPPAARAIK